jgi:DNA-binding ferritin-like protein
MGELIALLFLARELAHREHLRTRSFAAHSALNEFYLEIVEKADAIAEAYQGEHGLLTIPMLDNNAKGDIVKILQEHVSWIKEHRYKAASKDDTPIQNLIDEAVETYLSTLYKLRFLS